MKILQGAERRRRISFVPVPGMRPTKERIRQALFNVLCHRFGTVFPETTFLEGFGGTGLLSLEALSKGAKGAVCVEKNRSTAQILQENLRRLGFGARAQVVTANFLTFTNAFPFDVIFLDPPYDAGLLLPSVRHIFAEHLLTKGGLLILELRTRDVEKIAQNVPLCAQSEAPSFTLQTHKKYGKISLLFFK